MWSSSRETRFNRCVVFCDVVLYNTMMLHVLRATVYSIRSFVFLITAIVIDQIAE